MVKKEPHLTIIIRTLYVSYRKDQDASEGRVVILTWSDLVPSQFDDGVWKCNETTA